MGSVGWLGVYRGTEMGSVGWLAWGVSGDRDGISGLVGLGCIWGQRWDQWVGWLGV